MKNRGRGQKGTVRGQTEKVWKPLILLDFRDINFLDAALRLRVALLVTCSPKLAMPTCHPFLSQTVIVVKVRSIMDKSIC